MTLNLPARWHWKRLDEICIEDRISVPPGSTRILNSPYLSLDNVESESGQIYKNRLNTGKNVQSNTFAFDERHVLYGKLRPYLNKVALPDFKGCCSTELIPLLPLEEVDRDYLAWILRHPETVHVAMQGKTGSRMPRANVKALFRMKVPLPTLEEQKRIARILNVKLVAVSQARVATQTQLEAAQALPAAYLRQIFNSPESRNWQRKPLGMISRLASGGTPRRGNLNFFGGSIPWVKTTDLNLSYVIDTEEKITESGYEAINGELLPLGTVMLAMYGGGGTIGKSAILGIPAATNQSVCSILPNYSEFIPEYLHYWLMMFRPYWMRYSSGNRKDPNINKEIIARTEVPLPDVSKQEEIVCFLNDKVGTSKSMSRSLSIQIEALEALPASLLRQAFNGEL